MRNLTADNFNTPATVAEKTEALRAMRVQRHVNRNVLATWDEQNPYVLTLGKLYGLKSTTLGVGTQWYAKQHGVTIEHPVRLGEDMAEPEPVPPLTVREMELLKALREIAAFGDAKSSSIASRALRVAVEGR